MFTEYPIGSSRFAPCKFNVIRTSRSERLKRRDSICIIVALKIIRARGKLVTRFVECVTEIE